MTELVFARRTKHAAAHALARLSFEGVYRVTWRQAGLKPRRYIGMAPIVRACKLPGSRIGVGARWIVNSPERWEQRAEGMLFRRRQSVLLVVEPDDHRTVRQVLFEPLTRRRFLAMRRQVADHAYLERVLATDDMVRAYYWADWVPEHWSDQRS